MAYEVKLPDVGEGVAEGEIVRWLVKPGDEVREDQPLVEVMTDKASVEIPSPRAGRVAALLVEEGAVVPVGTTLLAIEVAGAAPVAAAAPAAAAAPPARAAGSAPGALAQAAPAGAKVEATPAVRALAKELGVALAAVRGTGPGGRLTADDVRAAAGATAGGAAAPGAAAPAALAAAPAPAPRADEPEERQPLRGLRRRIAEHMRRSLATAAQFTFVAECDFTAVVEHRRAMLARATAAGVRLTYLAYVFRALPGVLQRFPLLNASLDDAAQEVVLKRYWHLGLATSTAEGLTVPILHHADRLDLLGVAGEIERLAKAAREHKLTLAELQGGTFTVTSTGAQGGLLATPILHHPQVAILGVHAITRKPAVVDERIVIRDLGNLSLSLDHRVVDGAVGAEFLYALVGRLQDLGWLAAGEQP